MRKIFQKIKNIKLRAAMVPLIFFGITLPMVVFAQDGLLADLGTWTLETIYWTVAVLGTLVIKVEGWILVRVTWVLIHILQYNGFINSQAVTKGWTIVRDIANMMVVVILLIIALATILRYESYNIKKMLPKLLLMAILVNFSRTICGFFIDISQIITLSFVSAFANLSQAGNIISALGLQDIIGNSTGDVYGQQGEPVGGKLSAGAAASAVIAAIMLAITIMIIIMMLVIFVMRIIMLWLLVVLSPLAYILSAFPQGAKYAQQWWGEFGKNLVIGPVLAFFLWLTFAITSPQGNSRQTFIESDPTLSALGVTANSQEFIEQRNAATGGSANSIIIDSGIDRPATLMNFIIAMSLLIGALMMAQQSGVMGSQMAGNMLSSLRQTGMKGLFAPLKAAQWSLGYLDRKMYSGELPFGLKALKGFTMNPVMWYAGVKSYNERRRQQQITRGKEAAGFAYSQATSEKGLKRLAKLPGATLKLLTGSPEDFMAAYWRVRGVYRAAETVAGRRLWPTPKPKLERLPEETEKEFKVREERAMKDWKEKKGFITPIPYFALEAGRALEREATSKLPEEMEWTEVKGALDIAIQNKDIPRIKALIKKAAKDSNDNEVWNDYGYWGKLYGGRLSESLSDEEKEKTGIRGFGENVLVKQMGMSKQEMLSFMNDVAYINEDHGHESASRMVTVSNGIFEWQNEISRAASAGNERFKKNARSTLQNNNRLGTGGESSSGTGRKYGMDLEGVFEISHMPKEVANFLNRNEFNKSTLSKWQSDAVTLLRLDQLRDKDGERLIPAGIVHKILTNKKIKDDYLEALKGTVGAGYSDLEPFGAKVMEALKEVNTQALPEKISYVDATGNIDELSYEDLIKAAETPARLALQSAYGKKDQPSPEEAGGTPRPEGGATILPVDISKLGVTRAMVDKYGPAFFSSKEFDPKSHINQEDYERWRHFSPLEGVRGVKTASTTKPGDLQAGIGVDLTNPAVRSALGITNANQWGAIYKGDEKNKAADQIGALYRQQLNREAGDANDLHQQILEEWGTRDGGDPDRYKGDKDKEESAWHSVYERLKNVRPEMAVDVERGAATLVGLANKEITSPDGEKRTISAVDQLRAYKNISEASPDQAEAVAQKEANLLGFTEKTVTDLDGKTRTVTPVEQLREALKDAAGAGLSEIQTALGMASSHLTQSVEQMDKNVKELVEGLKNADTIRVRQNAMRGSDVDREERAHAKVLKLSDQDRRKIMETVSSSQLTKMLTELYKNYGHLRPKKTDDDRTRLLKQDLVNQELIAKMVAIGRGAYAPSTETRSVLLDVGMRPGKAAETPRLSRFGIPATVGRALGVKAKKALASLPGEFAEVGEMVGSEIAGAGKDVIQTIGEITAIPINNFKDAVDPEELQAKISEANSKISSEQSFITERKADQSKTAAEMKEDLRLSETAAQEGKIGESTQRRRRAQEGQARVDYIESEIKRAQDRLAQSERAKQTAERKLVANQKQVEREATAGGFVTPSTLTAGQSQASVAQTEAAPVEVQKLRFLEALRSAAKQVSTGGGAVMDKGLGEAKALGEILSEVAKTETVKTLLGDLARPADASTNSQASGTLRVIGSVLAELARKKGAEPSANAQVTALEKAIIDRSEALAQKQGIFNPGDLRDLMQAATNFLRSRSKGEKGPDSKS